MFRLSRLSVLFLCGVLSGCENATSDSVDPGVADAANADTSSDLSFPDRAASDGGDSSETRTADAVSTNTCAEEDEFSPNHGPDEPFAIERVGLESQDLYVCSGYDDYYVIDLEPDSGVLTRIEFAHRLGDLDLWLFPQGYSSEQDAVAVSATDEDVEEIQYASPEGGRFILVVDGHEDASGYYDLFVRALCRTDADCPCSYLEDCETIQHCVLRGRYCDERVDPQCGSDLYEPNNTMSGPYPLDVQLPTNMILEGQMCGQDLDYYGFELADVFDLTVELRFELGFDLDLVVLETDGDLVGYSVNQAGDREVLALPLVGPGSYSIYVDTIAGGTTDIEYDLEIIVEDAVACTDDSDCARIPGREICSESGGCTSFRPESPSEPGGPCDDNLDCAGDEAVCFAGEPGFDDNFCTIRCFDDAQCRTIEGGQCLSFGSFRGYCFGPCITERDCPIPYQCLPDDGSCEYIPCALDSDCEDGQACLRTESEDYSYCRTYDEYVCNGTEADGNGRMSTAILLQPDSVPLEELTICDDEHDWYSLSFEQEPARVEVSVSFEGDTDLDVYLYDAVGRLVGQGVTPSGNPEVAQADLLAAGDYFFVRINQFPGEDGDLLTTYSIDYGVVEVARCSEEDGECLGLVPLRISCLDNGACGFLEGNGEVTLGDLCDSDDDCDAEAEFCFISDGAVGGNNICTRTCGSDDDCNDIDGTTCTTVSRRFAACLPE